MRRGCAPKPTWHPTFATAHVVPDCIGLGQQRIGRRAPTPAFGPRPSRHSVYTRWGCRVLGLGVRGAWGGRGGTTNAQTF